MISCIRHGILLSRYWRAGCIPTLPRTLVPAAPGGLRIPPTGAITQTPAEAYLAIKVDEALPNGDARYVDLDAVRGTRNIAGTLCDLITLQEREAATTRDYTRFLLIRRRDEGPAYPVSRFLSSRSNCGRKKHTS